MIGRFGGVEVRNEYGVLVFLKPGEDSPGDLDVCERLRVPGETPVEALGITVRASRIEAGGELGGDGGREDRLSVDLDWERLTPPLVVRTRRPGDRLRPAGLSGTKKVKDIFIDAKVPRRLRDKVPIIEDGEGIVWVVGYAAAGRALASEKSREILRLKVDES